MEVNLMSDTVTRPTDAMLDYMLQAPVGDDVFGQDPTVNGLQDKVATMFGREAALYCPSGTMTNQIAIQIHCDRLDAVICEKGSHIYQYETGGYAYNARAAIVLLDGEFGKISASQIKDTLRPTHDWLSKTSLVVLENTCNTGGGSYYTLDEIGSIRSVCSEHEIALHLDGARLFNALAETGDSPSDWGLQFDSISICLSKGLGAPVGSVLIGDQSFIQEARRLRKVMGGGMRQAGIIAAAGIYALDHHRDRLREDHNHARKLGEALAAQRYISGVNPVMTNIVIFQLQSPLTSTQFVQALENKGIYSVVIDDQTVRFVTHLDISPGMIDYTIQVINEFST